MNDYLTLILADERARCYREGPIGFDVYVGNIGWVLGEGVDGYRPSLAILNIARAARAAYLAEERRADHDDRDALHDETARRAAENHGPTDAEYSPD